MAAYRMVRSRPLTFSGEFSGYAGSWSSGHPPVVKGNVFTLDVAAAWASAGASLTAKATGLGLVVTAANGLGDTDSDSDLTPITSRTLIEGTWSIEISEVEDWIEYSEGSAPTYGGAAVDGDVPGEATATLTQRAPSGATFEASITCGSVSATASGSFTSDQTITGYSVNIEAYGEGQGSVQDVDVEWSWLGWEIETAYSKADSKSAIAASGETCGLTTTDALGCSAIVRCSGSPVQGFELDGRLRADNSAYAGGGTVRVKRKAGEAYGEAAVSGGTYSMTQVQHDYSVSGALNGVEQDPLTVAEHDKTVYHWLVPPSGENVNQWRLLFRGAYYDAGTITQAETVAIDGDFTFTDEWTERTYSPAKSLAGYRYLVVATGQADKTCSLLIGNKAYSTTTTAGGLAIFDLCGPSNINLDVDVRDSRWPLPTDVDYVDADGAMWGVVNVTSLFLSIEEGSTATVPASGVYLSRDTWSDPAGHSRLNVVAPHLYYVPSGTAGQSWRPLLRGDTDGRRSLEEADWLKTDGTPNTYTAETIEDVFDAVAAMDSSVTRNPGWTAVIDTDIDVADGAAGDTWMAPDWALMNRNRNASWIEGSGIAYVAGAWRYALDVDVSSAYTLISQMLVDKVVLYPACGDVFGLRSGANRWEYGDSDETRIATLVGGRYMRGVGWGLVLGLDGTPYDGATVTLLDGAMDSGSGTSDTRGEYLTGAPGARHGATITARAEVGTTYPSTLQIWYGGLRRRICFTVSGVELGAIECDGVRQWLHVGFGARIRTYHLVGYTLAFESDEYANVDEWVRLRYDRRRAALLCLGRESSTTYRVYLSHDGGLSGSEVLSMTARTACIERDSERGMFVLMYENSGNVQRRVSLDGGATWEAATSALLGSSAFSGEILDMAQDRRKAVMLMAVTISGATKILESYDCGETWAVAIS